LSRGLSASDSLQLGNALPELSRRGDVGQVVEQLVDVAGLELQ